MTRYKSAAENAEQVEDELKAEKRKLQREVPTFSYTAKHATPSYLPGSDLTATYSLSPFDSTVAISTGQGRRAGVEQQPPI